MKKSTTNLPSRTSPQGFTLTELLVVILITVVLAMLALMGTQRVRAMADKATATRNLSQLQVANISYATDHNGRCVPIRANDSKGNATRWFQDRAFLSYYTGRPIDEPVTSMSNPIPLEMLDPKVVRARRSLHDKIYCSYGMNDTGLQLGGEPDLNSAHSLNQATDPVRTMIFATATDFRVNYNSRFKWDFKNPKDEKTAAGDIAYRHRDKVLVVYFDGHVGEVGKSDMERFDSQRGNKNPFWNPKS